MTSKYFLPFLVILLSLFTSCKKDEFETDYNKSYAAWTAFKSSTKNNYSYSVITNSWTGQQTETVLTIKNGKVMQRAYTLKLMDSGTGAISIKQQWSEDLSQLNTHQEGASILTLDEVYAKAKKEWLKTSKDVDTFFESTNNGMLSSAGYVEKGCTDDCFVGIKIGFIKKNDS